MYSLSEFQLIRIICNSCAVEKEPKKLFTVVQSPPCLCFSLLINNKSIKNPSNYVTLSPPTTSGESDMDRMFKLPSTTFIGGKEKYLPLK